MNTGTKLIHKPKKKFHSSKGLELSTSWLKDKDFFWRAYPCHAMSREATIPNMMYGYGVSLERNSNGFTQ